MDSANKPEVIVRQEISIAKKVVRSVENWIGKLQEGDIVEYDWKKAGEFKNITTIELTEAGNNDYNGSNGKDQRIVKMSCLKSAGMVLGPMDIEPKRKVLAAVSVAKYFEQYINNELDDEPSSNSKGNDKDRDYKYKDIDFGL